MGHNLLQPTKIRTPNTAKHNQKWKYFCLITQFRYLMQEMKLFVCVVLLCASQAWCEADNDYCQFTVGDKKVKYDLSALINRGNQPYRVNDKKTKHTYYFNFCNNIAPPPLPAKCLQTQGTTDIYGTKTALTDCDKNVLKGDGSCQAPVFQVHDGGNCYRLGKQFTADQKPDAKFLGHNPLHAFRQTWCCFLLFNLWVC